MNMIKDRIGRHEVLLPINYIHLRKKQIHVHLLEKISLAETLFCRVSGCRYGYCNQLCYWGIWRSVGCDKWMWHFNFYFKVSLPITTSIGIYLLLNLVFTPEHLWTDSLPTWWHLSDRIYRQRLQMPSSTWMQGHQLRGKKRWVKKHFSFGENFYLTLPKLSFDESNCQSYSASHSFVCSSRCLNPLLSILLSYPSVWLSGWLSSRAFFLPNSHSFVQNHFITYELVLFPTVRWIQKTPSTVCFGARDDSYGFFWTSKAGNIITFKLTHKSGYVTCHSSNPSYSSK